VKKLLYAGVVGPPLFFGVILIEGFTRPGYSQWHHFVSSLESGPSGWVQSANFIVFGILMIVAAMGFRGALRKSRGGIGAPILFGVLGISNVVAGIFTGDPVLGYPPGDPEVQTTHAVIHGVAGLLTFTLLPAACFVMAWHFASQPGERRWTVYSISAGVLVLVFLVASIAVSNMDAAGTWPNSPTGFSQRISIISGLTWIAMVAVHLGRTSKASSA
jgi:FtsH-binding integral membrane protein